MCSIIGSYDSKQFLKLVELNQHRGNFSHSFAGFNPDKGIVTIEKDFGPYNTDLVTKYNGYKIGHLQAPTGGLIKDKNRIHPTIIENSYLWHNGLLLPKTIRQLQEELNETETFDTYLLHRAIIKFGFDVLSEIEGLFTCLFVKGNEVFVFRTKHGKLYIDEAMNLSSERFESSKCINYDTIYQLDLKNNAIKEVGKFKTKNFNYVIKGEL